MTGDTPSVSFLIAHIFFMLFRPPRAFSPLEDYNPEHCL